MSHLVAIILGIVEGATEFIPVSSSGHLIIVRQLFGDPSGILGAGNNGLAFDAVLQLATSCALLVYFWKDILRLILVSYGLITKKNIEQKDKTLLFAILLGTIPAVVAGLFLETYMDSVFRNVHLVALTLLLGSLLFWIAQKVAKKNKTLSLSRGVVVGFFQILALVPGVSRSGATISGGLISGLSQDEAVRFSFLLSIPVLFGAGLLKFFEIRHEIFTSSFGSSLLLGSVTAFVVGLISINFLIKYLKNNNLTVFIWYRVALSIAIFFLF